MHPLETGGINKDIFTTETENVLVDEKHTLKERINIFKRIEKFY